METRLCRERRPARGRFRSNTKVKPSRPANSQHLIVGGGVPTPRQQRQRQAPPPANPQPSIVGRADPGAPGSSTEDKRHVRRIRSRHFLPPAGEGGIRRSPARRMTEEGERDRLQTVKFVAYPPGCGHFHIAVPPRSPSPAALVGGTLPRWGREWVRALWMTATSGKFAASHCRGRRPDAPAATARFPKAFGRIRRRLDRRFCGFAQFDSGKKVVRENIHAAKPHTKCSKKRRNVHILRAPVLFFAFTVPADNQGAGGLVALCGVALSSRIPPARSTGAAGG